MIERCMWSMGRRFGIPSIDPKSDVSCFVITWNKLDNYDYGTSYKGDMSVFFLKGIQ